MTMEDCENYEACKLMSFRFCGCLGDVDEPFSKKNPIKEIEDDIDEDFEVDESLIDED